MAGQDPREMDAVQLRILTHYAAGTQLSSIAAILGIDRDEVMDVVETRTGFDRSKAPDMIRRSYGASTGAGSSTPAEPTVAPSPIKRGRPAGRTSRSDPSSAYRSIALHLREAISTGQYAPGAVIPGANALAVQHGVSKKTAENAVQLLKDEGLLAAKTGVGTFVAMPSPEVAC